MRIVVVVLVGWVVLSIAAAFVLGAMIRAARHAPPVSDVRRAPVPTSRVRPAFDRVPTAGRRTVH